MLNQSKPAEEILETHPINGDDLVINQGRQLEKGYVLVNRYLIQEGIGMGGMGSVYCARDLHFPNVVKLVAVKEMINTATDPAARRAIVENFEREANILVTLSHPSIPKIFDYFTFAERSYLVTEFVNGKDLDKLLNETTDFFSEDQVVSWAIELCDVLNYLHTHKPEPIIFRDIKPSNIMVNQHNRIVLVDFGIAKAFRGGQRGTMVGTEGYSPPEQYRGEAGVPADIYSLGATLHHVLTRKDPRLEPPFTFPERPIRKINPAVSPELERIVSTALNYNVEERYPSVQAMKEQLLGLAHGTGSLKRAGRVPARVGPNPMIKPLWVFKCEEELRGSPAIADGIVYVCAYDTNLYALDASSGKFVWKYPTKGSLSSTPLVDNGVVYFGSHDHYLYALDARTGSLAWTCPTEGPINTSPRVMDNHLFFGSDDGFFYSVDMIATRYSWRIGTSGPIWSSAFVTSENLYFGNEEGEVYCLDMRGKIRWKFQAKRAVTSSPLMENQVVYFSSLDGQVYALDARSGWVIWRFRMGKGSASSPVKQNNLVYVGSVDGNIYCLDASNAREVWRYKTEHQVSGSPAIYKDALYCGSADGALYCLDSQTGQLRWKFATQGPITGTPVIYNDVLYMGSIDHHLYALSI